MKRLSCLVVNLFAMCAIIGCGAKATASPASTLAKALSHYAEETLADKGAQAITKEVGEATVERVAASVSSYWSFANDAQGFVEVTLIAAARDHAVRGHRRRDRVVGVRRSGIYLGDHIVIDRIRD